MNLAVCHAKDTTSHHHIFLKILQVFLTFFLEILTSRVLNYLLAIGLLKQKIARLRKECNEYMGLTCILVEQRRNCPILFYFSTRVSNLDNQWFAWSIVVSDIVCSYNIIQNRKKNKVLKVEMSIFTFLH